VLLCRIDFTDGLMTTGTVAARLGLTRAVVGQVAASVGGLGLVLVLAAFLTPSFYSGANLTLILSQVGFIGVTAIGQTFVLLVGGIDLSVGAVIGLTMVTVAVVSGGDSARLTPAVILAFALGLAVGAANAFLTVVRRVPPFIATFASFTLAEGALLAWTKGAPSGQIPTSLKPLGAGGVGPIPVPALIFVGLLAVSAVALARGTYGRRIYATGHNPVAARMAGVPAKLVVASTYLVCAACAVLGGLMLSGYTGYVDNQLIGSLNLTSIAAAVVGGTSLAGGRGGVLRSTVGVVLIACLNSFMLLVNAGNAGQLIIEGLVILAAVWLQARPRGVGSAYAQRGVPRDSALNRQP
jgi:ribose/xylose/arabinose/galactoside ABC-type transport system permease subunit